MTTGMLLPVEYQGHLTWSAVMVEYVQELPKLSVGLEQLMKHKEELEVIIHCITVHVSIM